MMNKKQLTYLVYLLGYGEEVIDKLISKISCDSRTKDEIAIFHSECSSIIEQSGITNDDIQSMREEIYNAMKG